MRYETPTEWRSSINEVCCMLLSKGDACLVDIRISVDGIFMGEQVPSEHEGPLLRAKVGFLFKCGATLPLRQEIVKILD